MGLEVKGLSVEYDVQGRRIRALENVTFEIKDGESVGIAGESACGKSTLGRAILRSLDGGKATSGYIYADGEQILLMPEDEFDARFRWKQISMVFQAASSSLDPVFSIKQQFQQILDRHGFEGDADEIAIASVKSVGLYPDVLEKFPHELSGGMKQRVAVAMATILNPKLIIASLRRSTTMTSAALSPTGALRHASEFFIASKVSFGKAYPVSFNAASPAASFVSAIFTPSFSSSVFITAEAESASSGPIPSPVIIDISYIL